MTQATEVPISEIKARRGATKAIAQAAGISPAAVSKWPRVPAEHVLAVERATGFSRHEIRPDIYPKEQTDGQTPQAAD